MKNIDNLKITKKYTCNVIFNSTNQLPKFICSIFIF